MAAAQVQLQKGNKMEEKELYIKQHNDIRKRFTGDSKVARLYEIHKKNYDISNTDNLAIKHSEIIQAMEEYNYNYNNIIDKAAADIAQKINEHLEQLQK